MKIQVLGCSATELPKSNLTSFLVDGKLLLDAGTIGSALDENEQWKIRHVLLSHAHLDHIKDLPFLADNISTNRKSHHVLVVSIAEVVTVLKQHIFNNIIWPDFTRIPTTARPAIRFKTIGTGKKHQIDGYTVTAFQVNHSVPAVGYLLEDKRGKRLLYMGDSGQSQTIWDSLKDPVIDALIIEVSLPNRFKQLALNSGHLTPNLLSIELRRLDNLPKRIFITHCKPRYREKIQEQLKRLKLPNIRILKDGQILEI